MSKSSFKHKRRQNRQQIGPANEDLSNIHRAGWCSSLLYATWTPFIKSEVLRDIPQSFHANAWTITLLYHDHSLSGCVQFSIDHASYHSTSCILDTDDAMKQASKQSTAPTLNHIQQWQPVAHSLQLSLFLWSHKTKHSSNPELHPTLTACRS
jgi:hypothetical protein